MDVKNFAYEYIKKYDKYIIKIAFNVINKCPRLEFEDVKQQLILSLLTNLTSFDLNQIDTCYTYFSQIIINSANNIVRKYWQIKNKANVECLSLDAYMSDDIDNMQLAAIVSDSQSDSLNPDNYYTRRELLSSIREIYCNLSNFEKRVFKMYMDGYTIAEIASKYKKSRKTIYNALADIKSKIKSIV